LYKVQNNKTKIVLDVSTEKISIAGNKISLDELPRKIKEMNNSKEEEFVIRPALTAKITLVQNMISMLKEAGIKNITVQPELASF
jgi:biopolymer transport protein ExbD